jgi:hypothetical protein
MTATYQQLLKKSYIQRLRNKKVTTGNDILLQLDRIAEDYQKDVTGWGVVDTTPDTVDFFDEVNEFEEFTA